MAFDRKMLLSVTEVARLNQSSYDNYNMTFGSWCEWVQKALVSNLDSLQHLDGGFFNEEIDGGLFLEILPNDTPYDSGSFL